MTDADLQAVRAVLGEVCELLARLTIESGTESQFRYLNELGGRVVEARHILATADLWSR